MSGACQDGCPRGPIDNSLSIFTSSRVEWFTHSLSRALDRVVFSLPQSHLASPTNFCEDLLIKHARYRLAKQCCFVYTLGQIRVENQSLYHWLAQFELFTLQYMKKTILNEPGNK